MIFEGERRLRVPLLGLGAKQMKDISLRILDMECAAVGVFPAAFRQRSFCGGNDQLQGRSAVHDKLPHGFNNRLRRAVQGRSVRYNPH